MQQTTVANDQTNPPTWGVIRSRFLAAKPPATQTHIFQLTDAIINQLDGWSGRQQVFRPIDTVIRTVALNFAAAAPFASAPALLPIVSLCLWEFILDDLLDDERALPAKLQRRIARCRAAVYKPTSLSERDPLVLVLREVHNALQAYSLFQPMASLWADAVCGLIDGMMREYSWRLCERSNGAASLPSYAEYMANGRYSVGYQPLVWTALIVIDDPSTMDHLDHLGAMAEIGAVCLRLANDLRTYPKEIAEGKYNALGLLRQELTQKGLAIATAHQQATAQIHAEIAVGLERLAHQQAHTVTQTGQPEAFIADVVRFACDFYTQHDYHILEIAMTGESPDPKET